MMEVKFFHCDLHFFKNWGPHLDSDLCLEICYLCCLLAVTNNSSVCLIHLYNIQKWIYNTTMQIYYKK